MIELPDGYGGGRAVIDGMVIAGYLAGALGAAGSRWVDGQLDGLLSSLTETVRRKLGRAPLDDLAENPDSVAAHRRVAASIERAAATDAQFARELAELQNQLGRREGYNSVILTGGGSQTVAGYGQGHTAGRDNIVSDYYAPQNDDLSGAPTWTKVCLWVGGAIAVFGWVIMMIAISQHNSPSTPGVGFAIFAAGGILMGAGELGARTSTPRRRR